MGYIHIDNLYRAPEFLLCQCYALEKIHGCVHEDSLIKMAEGNQKPIKDIVKGDLVKSYWTENSTFVDSPVMDVIIQEKTDLLDWFKLQFTNGSTLVCTEDHPIKVVKKGPNALEWIKAKYMTRFHNIVCFQENESQLGGLRTASITKLQSRQFLHEKYERYDLSIENTRNFVCNDIVVHNTSAHIKYRQGNLSFFSGGEQYEKFVALFDPSVLEKKFKANFLETDDVIVYGEAFGGKQQGMSDIYGKQLRFLAFDVKLNDKWLDVPAAEGLAEELEIGFVPYQKGPLSLAWLDCQRDKFSSVAVAPNKMREGIVIRPLREMFYKDGSRVIYKHKRPEFRETKTVREVNPDKAIILSGATAIAEEWVTPMRLQHVLQKVPFNHRPEDTGVVIKAMIEDVQREGAGEFEWSKEVSKAVSRQTVKLLKEMAEERLDKMVNMVAASMR